MRHVKRVSEEWEQPVPKEEILKVIEEHYGKTLISLTIDVLSVKIEYIE
jgi:hypothetical protein